MRFEFLKSSDGILRNKGILAFQYEGGVLTLTYEEASVFEQENPYEITSQDRGLKEILEKAIELFWAIMLYQEINGIDDKDNEITICQ